MRISRLPCPIRPYVATISAARRRHGRLALLLVMLSIFGAAVAPAQTTGAIRGRVVDESGEGLSGVRVTAEHLPTRATRTVASGTEGRFVLPSLAVGGYEIRAEAEGFKLLVRSGVELAVQETISLELRMAPGNFSEAINVTDAPPPINTQSGELGFLVDARTIETLPLNGRNYTDLALLQPNVQEYLQRDGGSVVAHGPGISVNGQNPRSNVYLLDGTLLNDFTNGPAGSAAGTALGTETIREFRVETNAYGAEYGRNSGGQITLITKSGTNDLRGSTSVFHRNDRLDARNYFDTGDKPDFARHQLAATLGGPVAEDKLFFFVGVEHLREDLGKTISTFVPDDDARLGRLPDPAAPDGLVEVGVDPAIRPYLEAYPRQNGPSIGGGLAEFTFPFEQRLRQTFVQGRVDYTPAPGRQLFARYTLDDAEQVLPTDFPQFPRAFVSRNQFLTGEYRNVASAATIHTARVGFSSTRIGQRRRGESGGAAGTVRTGAANPGGHRHRRHSTLWAADLCQRVARTGRLQPRLQPHAHPRPAPAEGGDPGRTLRPAGVQPHLLAGPLSLPQLAAVSREPAGDLHRTHPGGGPQPRVGVRSVRPLCPGRTDARQPPVAQPGPALRDRLGALRSGWS